MPGPLRRETLAEQLATHLVQLMEQRQLGPGDFLPSATSLATEFGVSRTVVREALRMLEARGFIRSENGRGTIIQPITNEPLAGYFRRVAAVNQDALVELLEVRKGLEMESASLACQRASDEELAHIAALVTAMSRVVGQGRKYADLDAELHVAIASAAHNTMLLYLIESIREPLKASIEAGLRSRAKAAHHQRVQALHEDLADALGRRDGPAAAAIMALHFDEAVSAIVGRGETAIAANQTRQEGAA